MGGKILAGDNWRKEILAGRQLAGRDFGGKTVSGKTVGGKILAGYIWRKITNLDYDIK